MFNVVIIGGEDTENYDLFKNKCIFFLKEKAKSGCGITVFTTGDSFVDRFCTRYGIDMKTFYTDWDKHGKNALKERNSDLLSNANAVIYFDTGRKDPECVFNTASKLGLPCRRVSIT